MIESEVIKSQCNELEAQLIKLENDFFPKKIQLTIQLKKLQEQCTHISTTSARNRVYCDICKKRLQ